MSWGDTQLPPWSGGSNMALVVSFVTLMRGSYTPYPGLLGTDDARLEGLPSKRTIRKLVAERREEAMKEYDETVAGMAPALLALR